MASLYDTDPEFTEYHWGCEIVLIPIDWRHQTIHKRRARRNFLATNGSLFTDETTCGKDQLPCGVCDECASAGVLDSPNDP